MVGGLLLICLSIYLPIFFYLMENIHTPGSFGFFLFFCTGINNSNIFSDSLGLINIGLFYEFSPQWMREKM